MDRKHIEGIPFYTDEYVHLYYASSSPSYSHLDKCADQFLHPALVHRFEKSGLKSWLVELQLPHLVDIVTNDHVDADFGEDNSDHVDDYCVVL